MGQRNDYVVHVYKNNLNLDGNDRSCGTGWGEIA